MGTIAGALSVKGHILALAITVIKRPAMSAGKSVVATITFDTSYDAGGESLTAADLGMLNVEWLVAEQKGAASRIIEYDHANAKLKLYALVEGAPNTYGEVATASNQSTISCRIHAIGDSVGPAF